MDGEEFSQKTLMALHTHQNELDQMERLIREAAQTDKVIPNLKAIFKELSDAAQECAETLEFYGEEHPLPNEVRVAMMEVQQAIGHCASAFLLIHITEGSE
jgi:hypothetical protein